MLYAPKNTVSKMPKVSQGPLKLSIDSSIAKSATLSPLFLGKASLWLWAPGKRGQTMQISFKPFNDIHLYNQLFRLSSRSWIWEYRSGRRYLFLHSWLGPCLVETGSSMNGNGVYCVFLKAFRHCQGRHSQSLTGGFICGFEGSGCQFLTQRQNTEHASVGNPCRQAVRYQTLEGCTCRVRLPWTIEVVDDDAIHWREEK